MLVRLCSRLVEDDLRQRVVRGGEVSGRLVCPQDVDVPAQLLLGRSCVPWPFGRAVPHLLLKGGELEVEAMLRGGDFCDVLFDGAVGQVVRDDCPEQQQDDGSAEEVSPDVHGFVVRQEETAEDVAHLPEVLSVASEQELVDEEDRCVLDVDDLRLLLAVVRRLRAAGLRRRLLAGRALFNHLLRSQQSIGSCAVAYKDARLRSWPAAEGVAAGRKQA